MTLVLQGPSNVADYSAVDAYDMRGFYFGNWNPGTKLIPVVGGFVGERLRHELTWERLCNTRGKPAGNIGLDLKNENFNNSFKG